MLSITRTGILLALIGVATTSACVEPERGRRVLEIETSEVTSPDVTVSPDGKTLVLTALGHLFRVPVEGGEAQQLTFGPFYDEDPAFSPDGSTIAFASDRGKVNGDIFLLTLSDGEIRQVTDEFWAARPAWSPDSRSLLYLSHAVGSIRCAGKAGVHRVSVEGGAPEKLTDRTRAIRSVAFTSDGSLMWLAQETSQATPISVIEFLQADGSIRREATLDGNADRMAASPSGDFLVHRIIPWMPRGQLVRIGADGGQAAIADITRRYCRYAQPRFAVSPDGAHIYAGEEGKLWRYSTIDGSREEIPVHALISIVAPAEAKVPAVSLTGAGESLVIAHPNRTRNGDGLLFGAIGKIWWQADRSSTAEALTMGDDIERHPVLSPDGERAAYIRASDSQQDIVIARLSDAQKKHLVTGDYFWDLEWHPNGNALTVAQGNTHTFWILSVDAITGARDTLIAQTGAFFFPPRPHYAPDGQTLYYSAYEDGEAHVYALNLHGDSSRTLVARLPYHLANIQVSPNRDWIAFRRNLELWVAPLDDLPAVISEDSAVLVSRQGGRSYRFVDSNTIIFADEGTIREYVIPSSNYRDMPALISVAPDFPPPLLLETVRVLDFGGEGFSEPTSLLVREGRIARIGDAASSDVPGDAIRLNAEGRFAIPGLIEPHMHVEAPWWLLDVDQRAYISHGVTTVRDVGEPLNWTRSLEQRSALTAAPLPRYLYTGDMLQHYVQGGESGGVGYAESSTLVYDETGVRHSVRELTSRGVHGIKVYASLPMNLFHAAADESRRAGVPAIAHGSSVKEVVRCVLAGISFAEHLDGPSRYYDDVHQLLALAGIYWTPTLSIMGGTLVLRAPEEFIQSERGRFFQHLHENEIGDLAGGREHAVRLLIGTDNPEPAGVGASHHEEMQALRIAGFTPLEVIEIATRKAAMALGIDHAVGSLEQGKLADIILLDHDPLEDIANTTSIWRVIKGGRVFDPDELKPESQR